MPPGPNGENTPHELFALTDEQILEIEPELERSDLAPAVILSDTRTSSLGAASAPRNLSSSDATDANGQSKRDSSSPSAARNDGSRPGSPDTANTSSTEHGARDTEHVLEPPSWLAAQMKDPWSGEEARELWNGVQQARQDAAAYRAAIATPEDARALKELYPGGIIEARSAAERARLLDNIDRAYFGVGGGSREQTSAARAELAAMMLREDPAAFREMVFAGLRALENSAGVGATLGSPGANGGAGSAGGASPAPTAPSVVGAQLYPEHQRGNAAPQSSTASIHEAHAAAYASFEKAANEDLERSVGAAIERTLRQALPNLKERGEKAAEGARQSVPLRERLGLAVRQDVEAALKGDRQLGEQIAQILSARRFDNETRAQVVRLINDRARQLVPAASKRVINDWTHATLAAHRGHAMRADAASTRREVEPVATQGPVSQGLPANQAGPGALSARAAQTRPAADPHRNASRSDARRVDYRKLSDEQILEL
ncbi:MAG TPA: hypothetical protein VE263_00995 [Candidatus Angelobacter sp.]|nr:hypothetical protein [Candidatus Angelobacter sp.]